MAPTLFTSCNTLPPEGAAAPAVWQSQSRGPDWRGNYPALSERESRSLF
jgi:hypothetical protein